MIEERSSFRKGIETEFPADPAQGPRTDQYGVFTFAYAELDLSTKDSFEIDSVFDSSVRESLLGPKIPTKDFAPLASVPSFPDRAPPTFFDPDRDVESSSGFHPKDEAQKKKKKKKYSTSCFDLCLNWDCCSPSPTYEQDEEVAGSDRCLCGLLHIRIGTIIIGIIELVFIAIGFAQAVYVLIDQGDNADNKTRFGYIVQTVMLALWLVLTILMIYGCCKHRPGLILPHLVSSIVMLIFFIVQVVLIAIAGSELAHLAYFIALGILVTYFIYVEYCCYRWMSA